MNTDNELIFWLLVGVGFLLLLAILAMTNAVKNLLASDYFKKKLMEVEEKAKKAAPFIALLIIASLPASVFAQAGEVDLSEPLLKITKQEILIVAIIDGILLIVFWFMKRLFDNMVAMTRTQEEQVEHEVKESQAINKILTDAVPIEREDEILMDHDYDGIQELDNNLPPWWKWGFYFTIGFAVIYLLNYHVFGTGDLQIAEYNKEIEQANADIAEYLAESALNVDENSVTVLTESSDLNVGLEIYMSYCAVCHGQNGEGVVGPNMTDNYWIYGPSIKDLFKTIKYGAKNGMKSWKDELNPLEMQQVASYMKSLHGTNPANQKEAQGDYYAPEEEGDAEATIDSLAVESGVVADTIATEVSE